MYSLGYDIGSSSIKCAIFNCETGAAVAHGSYPAEEMAISSPRPGWAEQDPEMWWEYCVLLTKKLLSEHAIDPSAINTIGISYQMHGLVLVDESQTSPLHHLVRQPRRGDRQHGVRGARRRLLSLASPELSGQLYRFETEMGEGQ